MAIKRFQRSIGGGATVYTCRVCGRKTRNTGDEGSTDTCRQCFDLAGIENEISDGYRTRDDAAADIAALLDELRGHGVNVAAAWPEFATAPAAPVAAPAPTLTVSAGAAQAIDDIAAGVIARRDALDAQLRATAKPIGAPVVAVPLTADEVSAIVEALQGHAFTLRTAAASLAGRTCDRLRAEADAMDILRRRIETAGTSIATA